MSNREVNGETLEFAVDDRLKLMVVDDEPDNLDLLYRTFRKDFEVFKAPNGFKALEILAEEGEMAVIISDQRMPRMNGTEFLSRTVEKFPDTIRIVLTGYTDVEDLVEAINSGKVFRYITKPWNPEQLKSVVTQASETYKVVKKRTRDLIQALKRESFLNDVMGAIRSSLDYDSMLQTVVRTLGKGFDADYVVLHTLEDDYRTHENPELKIASTYASERAENLDQTLLEKHSQSMSQLALKTGELQQGTLSELAAPVMFFTLPFIYQQTLLAIVNLYRINGSNDWSEEVLQLTNSVTEQIALAISQAKLYQRIQVQTLQMRAELEVARQIQTNLLRQSLPDVANARIQARCLPAREVGGDFFEVFVHPQGDIWLAVGDVSGKGVPAALFMASAISVLRRELSQESSPSPEKVMQNLNAGLSDDLVSNTCFITMVLARYNPETYQLTYANAGHIYPLVWSATLLETPQSEPKYLKTRWVPLGILPVWKAEAGELTLNPGDTLLLTSDGLTEATVPLNGVGKSAAMLQQIGLWHLIQHQQPPLDLDNLLQAIQGDRAEQEDDQTVLSLEVM
ncbi:MAG: SpoIIE family protein phosphatase [Cyanobacteria bacterium P01_F01_bin.86]